MSEKSSTNLALTLSVIAIIIAVFALSLAWAVYNKYGEDFEEVISEQAQDLEARFDLELAQLEARARLLAIRARINSEEAYNELTQEVAEVRQDLEVAYENASAELRQDWEEIDDNLEALENDLRSGSANAVENLQNALEALQRDLLTDES